MLSYYCLARKLLSFCLFQESPLVWVSAVRVDMKCCAICPHIQVLITTDSCHVHREVARTMPILRRYSRAKLNADQVQTMGKVLDTYTELVSCILSLSHHIITLQSFVVHWVFYLTYGCQNRFMYSISNNNAFNILDAGLLYSITILCKKQTTFSVQKWQYWKHWSTSKMLPIWNMLILANLMSVKSKLVLKSINSI